MSFKSEEQKSTQTNQSSVAPWEVQAPYLQNAFSDAQSALNKAGGATAPTDYTAQFTPDQLNAFQKMLDYGIGNNANVGAASRAGTALTGAGASATQGALSDLAGFTPQGGTQSNIDAAKAYAAGQDIPSMVKAAMLSADQQANEQTLPALAREAAGTGNVNSSRSAIERGIVQRGLAQQAGALSSQLQGNAYNTGLDLAERNSEAANQNVLSAMLARLNGGNAATSTGVNAGQGAIGQQTGLFNIANTAIQNQNAAAQAGLTNEEQQYLAGVNDPFMALQNYFNIVGNKSFGSDINSSANTSTEKTPSGLQVIGGILSGLSDRRAKKDIHLIGELFDGTPVYRFRYKADPTNAVHVGLMAQDVEQTTPDAVIEHEGVKFVNYDMATRPSIVD